jgi:hypothetical protein
MALARLLKKITVQSNLSGCNATFSLRACVIGTPYYLPL